MARQSAADSDWDRREEDMAALTTDPCAALVEAIETLEEQIGVLEEGLPRAPGMERAALAKEITAFRKQLDARQRALRQCRGERG
jgi:hypothetical protein